MSDFLLILLCAGFTAYAFAAVMGRDQTWWAKTLSVAVFLLVGAHAVVLVWWQGDGRIFPGWQVSPEVRAHLQAELARGSLPAPDPAFHLAVLAAHLFAMTPRVTRGAFWRPLPATLFFLVLFFAQPEGSDEPIRYQRAVGPKPRAVYVTVSPRGEGADILVSQGLVDDSFVRVIHVHEAASLPPAPLRPMFTRDSRAVVLSFRHQRLFAIDMEGNHVGMLPVEAHEWPGERPDTGSTDVRRRLSQARREVAEFVNEHGGFHVE